MDADAWVIEHPLPQSMEGIKATHTRKQDSMAVESQGLTKLQPERTSRPSRCEVQDRCGILDWKLVISAKCHVRPDQMCLYRVKDLAQRLNRRPFRLRQEERELVAAVQGDRHASVQRGVTRH
jgi:hypothetical protein